MMKKIIFGALLGSTMLAGAAQADIVRVETAYNMDADIHRFYFIDENGAETFEDGNAGDSFGAALERVINSVGAESVTWTDEEGEIYTGQAAVTALSAELRREQLALNSANTAGNNLAEQVIAAQNAGITFTTSTSGVHIATINYRFTNQYGPDSNFNANAEGANHDLTDADINMGTATVHTTVNNAWADNIQGVVSDSDFRAVLDNAIDTAYSDGFDDGYHAGYGDGYDAGFADGRVTN